MHGFIWSSFVLFILAMVLLDLGVVCRQSRVISIREALAWTAVWIGLALVFNVFVHSTTCSLFWGCGLCTSPWPE